jgi:hypothetical protein
LPTEDDYELYELIYGNSRVLWRTQQCPQQAEQETESQVSFPAAYNDSNVSALTRDGDMSLNLILILILILILSMPW